MKTINSELSKIITWYENWWKLVTVLKFDVSPWSSFCLHCHCSSSYHTSQNNPHIVTPKILNNLNIIHSRNLNKCWHYYIWMLLKRMFERGFKKFKECIYRYMYLYVNKLILTGYKVIWIWLWLEINMIITFLKK